MYFVSEGAVVDWTLLPEPAGADSVDAPLLPDGSWSIYGPDLRAFVWGVPRRNAGADSVDAPLLPDGSWSIYGPDLRAFVWGVPRRNAGAVLAGATVTDLTSSSFRPRVNILSLPT